MLWCSGWEGLGSVYGVERVEDGVRSHAALASSGQFRILPCLYCVLQS